LRVAHVLELFVLLFFDLFFRYRALKLTFLSFRPTRSVILLQLFIAVIQENFSVAEELKRKQQIEAFIKKTQPKSSHSSWLDRWNPYRLLKGKPKAIAVQNLPPNLVLPLKKSIVRDFADVGAGVSSSDSILDEEN